MLDIKYLNPPEITYYFYHRFFYLNIITPKIKQVVPTCYCLISLTIIINQEVVQFSGSLCKI